MLPHAVVRQDCMHTVCPHIEQWVASVAGTMCEHYYRMRSWAELGLDKLVRHAQTSMLIDLLGKLWQDKGCSVDIRVVALQSHFLHLRLWQLPQWLLKHCLLCVMSAKRVSVPNKLWLVGSACALQLPKHRTTEWCSPSTYPGWDCCS